MKYHRIFLTIAVLVLASLACQAVTGGGNNDRNSDNGGTQPTEPATAPTNRSSDSSATISTDFPMTEDAFNAMEIGEDSILYYTKLSAEDAMQFYRDEYSARGYTERKTSTVISEGIFSVVFDGDPSGKAVVIQSVAMGDGSRTITIRLEDV